MGLIAPKATTPCDKFCTTVTSTYSVNGSVNIQLIPAQSRLPWKISENVDCGAQLAQHGAPEENAFIGAQILKLKVLDYNAVVVEQL